INWHYATLLEGPALRSIAATASAYAWIMCSTRKPKYGTKSKKAMARHRRDAAAINAAPLSADISFHKKATRKRIAPRKNGKMKFRGNFDNTFGSLARSRRAGYSRRILIDSR